MKKYLNKSYGFLKELIVDELRYSQDIFEEILDAAVNEKSVWLDLGCGHQLLSSWRLEQEENLIGKPKQIIGLDYDCSSLQKHRTINQKVQGTIDELPFPNNYFNLVTANMVVEHLDCPKIQFSEINRVLAENGLFVFHTVNEKSHFVRLRKLISGRTAKKLAAFLEDRVSDDVFAVHYKANSREEVEKLALETGFKVDRIKMISSDAVFGLVPPLSILELIWLRILMRKSLENLRTNMIIILRK